VSEDVPTNYASQVVRTQLDVETSLLNGCGTLCYVQLIFITSRFRGIRHRDTHDFAFLRYAS